MGKDIKIFIGLIAATFLIIVGFAIFFTSQKKETDKVLASLDETMILATPEFFDLGSVSINNGIVERVYEVKNVTDKSLKLRKMATSCMCTKAKISLSGKETRFFGMEGHGDLNPPINLEIKPGETAKVMVNFDPAAHGPQGVGSFDRSIFLVFSDPSGTKELKFSGTVTAK